MANHNYECKALKWDTDFFGVNSARVNLTGRVDAYHQERIMEFCDKYDFVTIFNTDNISDNNDWIGKCTKAFLADVNIQFMKELSIKIDDFQNDDLTSVTNNFARNEQVVKLARDTFQYSRFFNDKNIPQEKAKNIYTHWTECAFELSNKYFVISEREQSIAGYILFSIHENDSVIELIAVDEKHQGKKVGKSLIHALESFLIDKGITRIKVGTQVNNVSAVQFYSKMGFVYVSCGSVYHLWNR